MGEITNIIGIDPGSTTGVAIFHKELAGFTDLHTLDFWECIDYMKTWVDSTHAHVIVEAPVKHAMYARQEGNVKSAAYGNRMMSNAASNAREAELLADGIERLGFKVTRVRPKKFKRADGTKGKVTAQEVRELTGYEGSTNQHVRDAMLLCWEHRDKD